MTELPNAGLAVFYNEPHHDERAGPRLRRARKLDISLLRARCAWSTRRLLPLRLGKEHGRSEEALHALKNVPEAASTNRSTSRSVDSEPLNPRRPGGA